jgi:uncharacterized protein (DUF1786 family)
MDATQVLALISTILALIVGLEMRIKSLVKHYLIELKPNSGSSIKDQITRLEQKIDKLSS